MDITLEAIDDEVKMRQIAQTYIDKAMNAYQDETGYFYETDTEEITVGVNKGAIISECRVTFDEARVHICLASGFIVSCVAFFYEWRDTMAKWLESVYSDGSKSFVSNPEPDLNETVRIRIRMFEAAPVCHVLVRTVPNGAERLTEAKKVTVKHGLAYYEASLRMTENKMQYLFYLVCEKAVYYYNQKGITTYIPGQTYDFVLLANYRQPTWVKKSVFYQIFPDRFYNGNTDNDVKDGEYALNGHQTMQIKNWEADPLTYEQGHCLDFYGGDLEGVKQKIPYLKELGVTAVYLNPIFTAPSVHKYDCIDYFHVDKHLGGDKALEELSEELHKNGMRLILDISINHTGTAHKWFNRDGEFYDTAFGAYHNPDSEERAYYFFEGKSNRYKGWFDVPELPTLNYTSEKLRSVIYEDESSVIKKWLKAPYHIDGWRFDVADVFARNNEIQLAHQLWPQIRSSIRAENRDAYILAEDWGDCAANLQGTQWDSPMNYFGCARILRQFVGEPDLLNARNEYLRQTAYKISAEDVKAHITEYLAKLPFVIAQNQFNLIDSHDVPRLHNNPRIDAKEYDGTVMLQFTLIGAPCIYYGDEATAKGSLDTMEGCRATMPWSSNFKATQRYRLYHCLAQLRQAHEAFTDGGMKFLYAENQVVALARFTEDEAFVTIMSTGERSVAVKLLLGAIGAKSPVQQEDLLGHTMTWRQVDENTVEIVMQPHDSFIFECEMKKNG